MDQITNKNKVINSNNKIFKVTDIELMIILVHNRRLTNVRLKDIDENDSDMVEAIRLSLSAVN